MAANRTELGRAQEALVRALVADGEPPSGFDLGRLRAARHSLRRKRTREFARAWPALAKELGADERGAGERGADEQGTDKRSTDKRDLSLGEESGLLAGYALALARRARGELGPAAFLELCAFELRWRLNRGAATPRRGPALRLWRRAGATPGLRWVLALKTPWGAERWWSL